MLLFALLLLLLSYFLFCHVAFVVSFFFLLLLVVVLIMYFWLARPFCCLLWPWRIPLLSFAHLPLSHSLSPFVCLSFTSSRKFWCAKFVCWRKGSASLCRRYPWYHTPLPANPAPPLRRTVCLFNHIAQPRNRLDAAIALCLCFALLWLH